MFLRLLRDFKSLHFGVWCDRETSVRGGNLLSVKRGLSEDLHRNTFLPNMVETRIEELRFILNKQFTYFTGDHLGVGFKNRKATQPNMLET